MNEKIMRISDDILLIRENVNELHQFIKVNNQYTDIDGNALSNFIWSTSSRPFPVSNDGTIIIAGRINKLFDKVLYDLNSYNRENLPYINFRILLRQGYRLTRFFSFLVTISNSEGTIISNFLINTNDFKFNGEINRLKLDGDFWTSEYVFKIPSIKNVTDTLFISVLELTYDDIDNDIHSDKFGLIYSYNKIKDTLEPIIYNKLLPDTIQTSITKKGSFLEIKPYTTETNKTIKQSIGDYLKLKETDIYGINVEHKVMVGNIGTENHRTNIYQNYDNPFGPISFVPFVTLEMLNDINNIECQVETTYKINGLFNLIRTSHIILSDIKQILDNTIFEGVLKTTFQPIEIKVNDNNIIENKIIETKETVKYLELIQYKYVEMITDKQIKFERKLIGFKDLPRENDKLYKLVIHDNDDIISTITSLPELYLVFDLNNSDSDKIYKKLKKTPLNFSIVQLTESNLNSDQIIEKGVITI